MDDADVHLLSDEALAALARSNPGAFGELYRRYLARVYRYHYARVGHAAEAEDLTAQTFLSAMCSLGSYREDGAFAAWLMRIARNRLVDTYRARGPELSLDALDDVPAATDSQDDLLPDIDSVRRALAQLPAEQAEAVRLRLFSELSTAHTAQAMGKSEAAVKMLLYRAMRTMRRLIETAEFSERRL